MAASESLTKGSGLNDSLMGKLLVRRGHNAQSRGCFVSSRHARSFGCKLVERVPILSIVRSISLSGLLLKPGLDDASLLFLDIHTLLQMFFHDGIPRDKAG
jgi:hypothetical protein